MAYRDALLDADSIIRSIDSDRLKKRGGRRVGEGEREREREEKLSELSSDLVSPVDVVMFVSYVNAACFIPENIPS